MIFFNNIYFLHVGKIIPHDKRGVLIHHYKYYSIKLQIFHIS